MNAGDGITTHPAAASTKIIHREPSMRKQLIAAVLISSASMALWAATPATKGARVGEWTMDYDAAKTLAKDKNLPILINFTGSDWCGWCKLMDRQVFSKPEWKAYAKDNLVLVFIDFPQDKTLVPMHLVSRNDALARQFGVRGFPTYFLLGADGTRRLGQLGASHEATPASFIADIRKLLSVEEASRMPEPAP
ncbi:MAG: thioredoxin family protein [Kiritimatiellia bacterium]